MEFIRQAERSIVMILLDNTVLSNFALIHHPEFIRKAFVEEIGTTNHVFQELEQGVRIGRLPELDWAWLQRISMTEAEEIQFRKLAQHLGNGEAACLSIAFQRRFKIATDDKDARQWAMRLTIPFTGTLGILAILVKQEEMTLAEGNACLSRMIETGYHSPMRKLDELLQD